MSKYSFFKNLKKYFIFFIFKVPSKIIKFFKKQIVYRDVVKFNTRFKTINNVLYFTLYILNKIAFFFEVIILSSIASLIVIFWLLICGQIIFILLIFVVLIFCFISNSLFSCSFLKNLQQDIISNDLKKIFVIFFKVVEFYWFIIGYMYGLFNSSDNIPWIAFDILEDILAFFYSLFCETLYYKNILNFIKVVSKFIYYSYWGGRLGDNISILLNALDIKIRRSVNEFILFFPNLISYIFGYLYQRYKSKYKKWVFYPYEDSNYDSASNQIRVYYVFDFEDYDFPLSFIPAAIHFYRFIFTKSHHQLLNFINPELPKIMFIVITFFIHLTVIYLLIKFIRFCFRVVYAFLTYLLSLINQTSNYLDGLIDREYQFYKNKKKSEENKSKGNTANNNTTNNNTTNNNTTNNDTTNNDTTNNDTTNNDTTNNNTTNNDTTNNDTTNNDTTNNDTTNNDTTNNDTTNNDTTNNNTTNNNTTNNNKKRNEISEAEYIKLSNIEREKCLEMLDFIDNFKPLKNDPQKRYLYKKNALIRLEKNINRLNKAVKKK